MPERFKDRNAVIGKIEWEGGITAALDYGLTAGDMPEGDTELIAAWAELEGAYSRVESYALKVERILGID